MSAAPEFDDERPVRQHVQQHELPHGAVALGDGSLKAEGASPAGDGESAEIAVAAPFEPRARAAWQSWLSALATDAEAALAAALAYDSLDEEGREAWLDVLEQDAPALGVPALALYAPLLSV